MEKPRWFSPLVETPGKTSQCAWKVHTITSKSRRRIPTGIDELGEISRSINRMAFVRGRLEEELRPEDRLRGIGRTVAGIAHEIRNPLNGIRLSMQLLEQRLKRGSVQPEDLGGGYPRERVVGSPRRCDPSDCCAYDHSILLK
jgi:signal transduction histidine kinase